MILDEILEAKRREIRARRRGTLEAEWVRRAAVQKAALDLYAALAGPDVRLIAEIKRASPSRGIIAPHLGAAAAAADYLENGAAAISVLTDESYFHGTLDDVTAAVACRDRMRSTAPVLRKEFIIDPLQILEARAAGADAVLLIARVLDDATLGDLLDRTLALGMSALVEVHDEAEIDRLAKSPKASIVGINSRDLATFRVDLARFERLRSRLPATVLAVAESGIRTAQDVRRVGDAGADAVLVGESLVTAGDRGRAVRDLVAGGRR